MGFFSEEKGQLSLEELPTFIVVVLLFLLFIGSVAYSYNRYEDRKDAIERFEVGLDFSSLLKNDILMAIINGAPNPGLINISKLQETDYTLLARHWNRDYDWGVVIRDCTGEVVFERGKRQVEGKSVLDSDWREGMEDLSIILTNVALLHPDGRVSPANLEVYVW